MALPTTIDRTAARWAAEADRSDYCCPAHFVADCGDAYGWDEDEQRAANARMQAAGHAPCTLCLPALPRCPATGREHTCNDCDGCDGITSRDFDPCAAGLCCAAHER